MEQEAKKINFTTVILNNLTVCTIREMAPAPEINIGLQHFHGVTTDIT